MTNLTTYPLQDWFETSLAQSWNGATGTVFLNTAPSFTFPSGVKTYIVVNPWKTNMQVGRIDSMNVGNKTVNVDSVTIEKWAGLNYTAQIHAVGSKVIISDNYQFWKDISTAINSKADTASPVFTGSITVPEYADDTARDAAIPTPTDWMIVQTGGVYQGYNSGTAQWEDFDIGTPAPNASTTVKWLVQIATTAQVWASTTTGSTGAELAINPWSVVKTSSGVGDENKLPALNASWQLDAWFINNATILAEWVEALVDKDTYLLWEPAAAGDSLFVEDMVTFASADQVQAIGDVTANTRVSIPVIWSGVASNTLKLALKKFVSPWVDLGVRIETDNAGEPSGTAVTNGTATVTEASLTTSLVDTTVTLAWSVTLTEWTKYHIVLFAGTYGSETINGTNYFGVGYTAIDTTTRRAKTWNGTVWSAGQATRFYYTDSDLFTDKLLSLTDATYSYKLPTDVPRIATESKGTGENVIATTLWFNDNFSGLTPLADYYLADTPWAISATEWTNFYIIWKAVSSSVFNVKPFLLWYWTWIVVSKSDSIVTTSSLSYTKLKEIACSNKFTYNVYFEISRGWFGNNVSARIYVNWIAVGTVRTINDLTPVWYSEFISVNAWDLLQIYWISTNAGTSCEVRNFRIWWAIVQTTINTVNI